jgi:hypothetical protein
MALARWSCIATLACLVICLPLRASALTQQQTKLLNQLDELDHQEFLVQIIKADSCIETRDFDCAVKKIGKAAKFAMNNQDKKRLAAARLSLAQERQVVADEEREAARREAERREEEARQEAELQREAEAAERQQAREERQLAEQEREMARAEERMRADQERAERDSGPSTAEQVQQFGQLFLQNYADTLAASRAAKAEAYAVAQQRQADYAAENARRQEKFAQQKAQLAAQREEKANAAAQSRRELEQRNRAAAAQRAKDAEARQAKLAQVQEQARQQKEQEQARREERARDLERKQEDARKKAEADKIKLAAEQAAKRQFRKVPNSPPEGRILAGLTKSNGEYRCEDVNTYARQNNKVADQLVKVYEAAPYKSEERCQARCDLLSVREVLVSTYRYSGSWSCSESSVGIWNGVDAFGDYRRYNGGNNEERCTCITTNGATINFSPKPL